MGAMKKLTGVFVLALAVSACGGGESSEPSADDTTPDTTSTSTATAADAGSTQDDACTTSTDAERMGMQVFPGQLLSIPEFVGVAEGIYEKYGIEAELLPVNNGPEATAALVAGAVDVMSNSPGNMLVANAQGQGLVYVNNYLARDFSNWVAQADYPTPNIDEPFPAPIKDFEGATIGVSASGSQVELQTRMMLDIAGVDPNTVEFVSIGFGQPGFAAFQQGEVDIAVGIDPMTTFMINAGGKPIVDLRDPDRSPEFFNRWPGNGRIAVGSVADEKSELFQCYNQAQAEVLEFVADPQNLDRVAAVYAEQGDLELEIATQILENYQERMEITFDCGKLDAVMEYMEFTGLLDDATTEVSGDCETFMWEGSMDLAQ